jgi:hypothetical protein
MSYVSPYSTAKAGKALLGSQKSEVRSQKSEVRSQKGKKGKKGKKGEKGEKGEKGKKGKKARRAARADRRNEVEKFVALPQGHRSVQNAPYRRTRCDAGRR